MVEGIQFGQGQVEGQAAQGRTQPAIHIGLGAGLEPVQQTAGLLGGEHRILVRQIDAAHPAPHQRLAYRLGLAAGAHQDGDVGGPQWRELAVFAPKAGLGLGGQGQQPDDLAGGALGQGGAIGGAGQRLVTGQLPEGQGRTRRAVDLQDFTPPLGTDRLEGHRIVLALAEEEGRPRGRGLAMGEHLVDRRDHRGGGTEVGVQRVQVAGIGAPRLQIGMDVGAAEGIDGLLGIADQE